ncbi:Hypothetical predicted protein [Pelobates cultripes]|uniref:Uncharacterized protein n=1 Tax=Pelobates cultripes TaxID=61616 RepID=A0AAD1W6S9_PELCU|nr:Hypothetical predicted protein [Pelobates cultripes]
MAHNSPEMGHTRPKTTATTNPRTRDISKLLTCTPIPKDLSEEEVSPPRTRPNKPTPSGSSAPAAMPASTPSTKQDIADLYDRIRTLFDADIALVKEDMHVVTERLWVTEEEVMGLNALEETVLALQSSQGSGDNPQDHIARRGSQIPDSSRHCGTTERDPEAFVRTRLGCPEHQALHSLHGMGLSDLTML